MNGTTNTILSTVPEQVLYDLRQLNVPIHLSGHRQLCIAISKFAEDITQSMCGEVYPAVAKAFGHMDWRAVEFSIRRAILAAWIIVIRKLGMNTSPESQKHLPTNPL